MFDESICAKAEVNPEYVFGKKRMAYLQVLLKKRLSQLHFLSCDMWPIQGIFTSLHIQK